MQTTKLKLLLIFLICSSFNYAFCQYNTSCSIENIPNTDEVSGLAYNPNLEVLYAMSNGNQTNQIYLSVIPLDGSANPQPLEATIELNGFGDPEGITHITGTQFAIVDEEIKVIYRVNIDANTTVVTAGADALIPQNLPVNPSKSIEGLAYSASDDRLYFVVEGEWNNNDGSDDIPGLFYIDNYSDDFPDPTYFEIAVDHNDFPGNCDFSGLSILPNGNLIINSHTCSSVYEVSVSSTNVASVLSITNTGMTQAEGVAVISENEIWVAGETGADETNELTLLYVEGVTSCNDADDCTTNDVYGADCNCAGSLLDSDNDNICDLVDPCPNFNNNLIGTACNDGDNCTVNDVYGSDCNCAGTLLDSDNDGVCDADDLCPGFNDNLIGTACNDGDNCTVNDVYGSDCNCAGTLLDSDNDGVCDADDLCPNFNDNLIGTACNDGDNCTINDVYGSDCNCAGTLLDSDNDGVCDADDLCPNFNDNLIGTACDDGDSNTTNDVYTSNCICAGTINSNFCPELGLYVGDACSDGEPYTNNDTVNSDCQCIGSTDPIYCPELDVWTGDACDDGTYATLGDVITPWCTCEGMWDLVLCLEINMYVGDSCDDGNPNTVNDQIYYDCECVGEPINDCYQQFPSHESFETDLGVWTQGTDDNIDWIRHTGPTPSANTGPSIAVNGAWYMYIEASNPNVGGKTASLVTECMHISTTGGAEFLFDYQMFGTVTDNVLEFQVSTDEGNSWTTLWSNTGSGLQIWYEVILNLEAYMNTDVYFRFFGTTGSHWRGDIAIDNIKFNLIDLVDCPELGLNIGDSCNDQNSNTTNDEVNDNCDCVGTTNSVFCSSLGLYVGDACYDGNSYTDNDTVNSDCECEGVLNDEALDLSLFNNSCGVMNLNLITNLSGTTYSPDSKMLYGIRNSPTEVLEIDLEGNIVRSISLSNFEDTESIVYVGANQFFVSEERRRRIALITIGENTSNINYPGDGYITAANEAGLGDNFGFEGLAYDATNDILYVGTEGNAQGSSSLYAARLSEISNPLSQIGNSINLPDAVMFLPYCPGFDIGGLSIIPNGNILLLSDNCSTLWELDSGDGNIISEMAIDGFSQPEGVTLINENEIWVFGESNEIAQFVIPGTSCLTDCYQGATWDNNCNCSGGSIIDNDSDGFCAADDPDDNNICVPEANDPSCNGGNGGTSCSNLLSNDFESGYQGWVDGGSDCRKSANDASYAHSGSYCIRLRDNSNSSDVTSPTINTTNSDILELSFTFITNSMETNEDFWLQISSNNGSSWSTVETWVSGTDFQNGVREFVSLQISSTNNTTTKLRFVCDASANSDKIYIDDVYLEKCVLTVIGEDDSDSGTIAESISENISALSASEQETVLRKKNEKTQVSFHPNPLSRSTELFVEVNNPDEVISLELLNLEGKRMIKQLWLNESSMKVPISTLTSGTYIARLITKKGLIVKKIVVLD